MAVTREFRSAGSGELSGREIFEIKPVILGGNPKDPANKIVLTRAQHIDAVRYWNGVIRQVRAERASPAADTKAN
jgi:hypothetical protein